MKGNYSAEIERLKAAVSDLKAKLEDVMENRSERNRWISHFTQFATLQELDRRVVVQLIQSIRVMSKNELRITFNYADEYQKALALYQGDFLPRLASEAWVVPKSARLHEFFVRAAVAAAEQLERGEQWAAISDLCSRAVAQEPYNEELYLHQMRALLAQGRGREAVSVYQNMEMMMLSSS